MDKRNGTFIGLAAGMSAGVSYGLNPLFAKSLLENGVDVYSMLFLRYAIAAVLMGLWMAIKRESFSLKRKQIPWVTMLGLLFAGSSIGLFESYRFIPAGLSTTLVYLYPAFTAIIMAFAGVRPSLKTCLAIAATLAGVLMISFPGNGMTLKAAGLVLAILSALSYAVYLVLVNNVRSIEDLPPHTITFYALASGTCLFGLILGMHGTSVTENISGVASWADIVGLAVFPTMISMLSLAIATRNIGATRTAILGVFEPITAILIGVFVFGEVLTVQIAAGILVCILAMTLIVK